MKKLLFFLLFALIFSLFSCSDDTTLQNEPEVELVQISENSIVLYKGQSYKVVPTVLPVNAAVKDLTWTASSSEVCTVEDGIITAVSEGVSVITAKAANGKSASLKVQVKEIGDIEKIYFEDVLLSLEVGATYTLNVICSPYSASDEIPITWSSSDDKVASVDRTGKVTANGEGACFIFADVNNYLRAVSEVRIGDFEADLSELVELSVKDLPRAFEYKDISGNVITTVELTSYEVERELTKDGVTVTLLLKGKKIYDRYGEDAKSGIAVAMDLYMENDEHCAEWTLTAGSGHVGEDIEFKFAFNAVLKPYTRTFSVILKEVRSESAE